MNDCRVRFQPIPRSCPIPRDIVALIGGYTGLNPTFVLSVNGREITVEAPTDPPDFPTDDFDPDHPFYEWLVHERSLKIYAHYLEIIQSLLGTLEFGKTNWAYLTHQRRVGYQLTQRKRRLPKVTCPPWASFIHENEVEYTVYGLAGDRRGIWDGKEVDIMIGWTETHIASLDRAMYGYRMLEGEDLTFEVYGHLIGSDGSIIGIVTEAAWGRMPTLGDRGRIYQSIAKLQQRGILYKGCLTNRFMVANGRVRLLDLASVYSYAGSRQDLELEAENWHWNELSQLFHEIECYGPYGNYRVPPARFVSSYKDLEYLPLPPSLERPLGGIMLPPKFFIDYLVDPWPEYSFTEEKEKEAERAKFKKMDRTFKHSISKALYIVDRMNRLDPSSDASDEEDTPLPPYEEADRPLPVSLLRRHRLGFHPYLDRYKRQKFLAGSDTTSSTASEYYA